MQALPIFFTISNRLCLVVGGGDIATRKVNMLLKANGQIRLVSPYVCAELQAMIAANKIQHLEAEFESSQLEGACLVIAATDDEAVNEAVSMAAKAQNIPVNVVDAPALCTFTMGSIIDRSPIVIAVSSEGNAPVLARYIRTKIETILPSAYGRIAAIAGEFRDQVKDKFNSVQARRIFWEEILQGPFVERVLSGQEQAAKTYLKDTLKNADATKKGVKCFLWAEGLVIPIYLLFVHYD